MKNKFFKTLASSMVIVLTMTACGSTNEATSQVSTESSDNTQVSTQVSKEPVSEVPKEPVVFTALMDATSVEALESNLMTQYLEEKFNIDFQFEVITAADDFNTRLNLMITEGEYPDIIFKSLSNAQIVLGAEAGAFLPLNDYIVEGTYYKAALDEHEEWRDYLTANDGNIYTFFNTDCGKHMIARHKMVYRTDWLEKLGWKTAPSTPEEFKQYLIDIRDNDVNGNGDPNDEIPLCGFVSDYFTDPLNFLMNPFELSTSSYYHITDDGKLYFEANTDGWRKGLSYIADLYAEGLIAEETYIQDINAFKAVLNKPAEEALIGVYPHFWHGAVIDNQMMDWTLYEPLVPLKGDYQQTAARMGDTTFGLNSVITTGCENPDLAFEVLDYLLSPEGDRLGKFGPEGMGYEWSEEKSFLGTTPSINNNYWKEKGLDGTTLHWTASRFPCNDTPETRYGVIDSEEAKKTVNTSHLLYAASLYEPYYVCDNIPLVVWADDEVLVEKAEYATLINEYVKTSYVEFICGIRDINDDKQWQAYLDELNAMGLERYLEILTEMYDLK